MADPDSVSVLLATFFQDPEGSWPSDLSDKIPECTTLSASPSSYVDLYNDQFIMKSILKPPEADTPRLKREVKMTLLAGDCAIPIVGRYFNRGVLTGFISPFGKCLSNPQHEIRPEFHSNRHSVIKQFCSLLSQLHAKGIIHGDVKPSNLVFDQDGNLRFIDFAESLLDSEPPARHAITPHYKSPSSLKNRAPLTHADDFYAAGVTVWHIYTGRVPFHDIDEDDLYDLIAAGLRPDLSVIDDEEIRTLIGRYLQDGEPPSGQESTVSEGV